MGKEVKKGMSFNICVSNICHYEPISDRKTN